jgi:signal transduction histidine kinase/ActR/RegA family two-component response regulator
MSAASLQSLLDLFNLGVFRAAPEGELLECNPALLRLLGVPDFAAACRLDLGELVAAPRLQEGVVREVLWMRGGAPVWLAVSRACGRDAQDRPVVDGLVEDVTARREAEEECRLLLERETAARAAAEAASLTKDEFLATLSHELRTPLNGIVGWASLLRSGTLKGERLARALASIERNAGAQARLIDDLLDVSAIISGKMRLEIRPLYLTPVIEAALDAVRPAAEAKSIHLEAACDALAGAVPGDADRLQQVVWNLLSNSVKFTPRGGTVRVCLERSEGQARIVVSDTGRGIAPEFLEHVFEPFRQADGSSTRSHRGLGLGLAIVRRLVELHGGQVRAESGGPGRGARFTVEIPSGEPLVERRQTPVDGAAGGGFPGVFRLSLDGLRVLVVDDEPDFRDLLVTLLEERGAAVHAAASAAEALRTLPSLRPDVLLSDIAMPDVDGYELIRRLRALPAESGGRVPAVALTAYARAEDRRRVLLSGFNMYLAKPVDPEELVAVVASLGGRLGEEALGTAPPDRL